MTGPPRFQEEHAVSILYGSHAGRVPHSSLRAEDVSGIEQSLGMLEKVHFLILD